MAVRTLALTGQWLGVISAVAVLLLVVSLGAGVESGPAVDTHLLPTAVAAVCALLGTWQRSPTILAGAFLLGLLPWLLGASLLGTAGPSRWIALAQAGYLAAALLLRAPRREIGDTSA